MTTMRLEDDIPVALAPLVGLISMSSKGSLPGARMVSPREEDGEMLDKAKTSKTMRPRSSSTKPARRKTANERRRSSSLDIFQKLDRLKGGGDTKKMSRNTRSASRRLQDDSRSSSQVRTEESRKDNSTQCDKDPSSKRLNKSCSALEHQRTRTSKSHSPRRHTINPKKQGNNHSKKSGKSKARVSKAICSDSSVAELEFYDWANHTHSPHVARKTMKSSKSNLNDRMSKSCNTLEGQRTSFRREIKQHVRRTISSPTRESKERSRSSKKTSIRSSLVKSSSNPDLGDRLNKSHNTLVDQNKSVNREHKKPVRRTRSSPKIKEHAHKSYTTKSASRDEPNFEFHIHPRSPPIEYTIQGSRNSLNKSCNSIGGQNISKRRRHSTMDQRLTPKGRDSELASLKEGNEDIFPNQRSPSNSPGSTPRTTRRTRVDRGDTTEISRLSSSSTTRHRSRRLEESHHQKNEARQSRHNSRDTRKDDSNNVTKEIPPLKPFSKLSARQASEEEPKSHRDVRRSESLNSSIRRRSSRISMRRERPIRAKSLYGGGDDDDDDDEEEEVVNPRTGLSQSCHDNRHDRRLSARNPGRRQSLKRESMRQPRPLLANTPVNNDIGEEDDSAMDPLTSMRKSYHDNRHGRRTVSHSPVRRQSYKGKAAQQIAMQSLLDSDEELEENLVIGAYDDGDEQDTPVGYKSARMSVIGRKGPRLTADSLMGKLGMNVATKLLPDNSEHTAATMDESQSERSILGMAGIDKLTDELEEDLTIGAYDDEIFTTSTRSNTDLRASATMKSSTIVLPHTQQVKILAPPREGALAYTGAHSDLYNDEGSFVNGI